MFFFLLKNLIIKIWNEREMSTSTTKHWLKIKLARTTLKSTRRKFVRIKEKPRITTIVEKVKYDKWEKPLYTQQGEYYLLIYCIEVNCRKIKENLFKLIFLSTNWIYYGYIGEKVFVSIGRIFIIYKTFSYYNEENST